MNASSEYTFPIFISSTDYNLKDLRAELARYLEISGYKAILSSAEGFPDSSPNLEPWESCLPALEHSFVMSLIIDGKYGQALDWPNFKEIFEDRAVSPTHAEYIFAHRTKKRMFVFIRKELMAYYQSYRRVMKDERDKLKEKDYDKLTEIVKGILEPTLPKHIDFKILEFINEVKTKKPIPWIMEFEDVTDVKTKLQKKLLNELAEVFLIKEMRFDTVINALNKILDGLSEEEQNKALKKINIAKDFPEINEKLIELEAKLKESNSKLDSTKSTQKKVRAKLTTEIESLNEEINELKQKTHTYGSSNFLMEDGKVTLNDFGISGSTVNLGTTGSINIGKASDILASGYSNKCDNCDKKLYNTYSYIPSINFNTCPSCKRYLCNTCWPEENYFTIGGNLSDICPKCKDEKK